MHDLSFITNGLKLVIAQRSLLFKFLWIDNQSLKKRLNLRGFKDCKNFGIMYTNFISMLFSYVHVCSFITYEEELYVFILNSKSRIYFYLNSFIRFDISEHDKLNQIETMTWHWKKFSRPSTKATVFMPGASTVASCVHFFIHDVMLNSRCGCIKHVSL